MDPLALDLANKTLASALDSLMTSGSPFVPIVLVEKGGQHDLRRVVARKVEDAAEMAKEMAAAEPDADATAFAVDGVIPYNGARFDAIIVEAWNFRASRGARVGLRYELKGVLRKKPSLIGSPLHLGREGWYDPEDGEPEPVIVQAPLPPTLAPVPDVVQGFGPQPTAASIAPSHEAPPSPSSAAAPELPALPRAFVPPKESEPDFGPPPTSPAVQGFPPPNAALPTWPAPMMSAETPVPVEPPTPTVAAAPVGLPPWSAPGTPAVLPLLDTAPPSAAHPVDVPSASSDPVAPTYVPVPLQRNETPLGNRAMFAGIMELATKGRSFPAFAIVQKDGAWEQVTMTDASLEDAAASVRAYARTRTDAEFIAFAIDGSVPVDDIPTDAVIVEVWEYATRVSFSVAQRYIPTGNPPSPRLSGRPLMRTQTGWVDVPSAMTLGGQVQFGYRDPDAP